MAQGLVQEKVTYLRAPIIVSLTPVLMKLPRKPKTCVKSSHRGRISGDATSLQRAKAMRIRKWHMQGMWERVMRGAGPLTPMLSR
jgi:hypothetical protein